MSKYTTELRWLIENKYDIGLKQYPIFDESYRNILNSKIIDHYYFREIGAETVGLFKRFLNRTMNEIMPYYNQLYKSELLEYNPLVTKQLLEEYKKENVNETTVDNMGSQQSNATTVDSSTTDNTSTTKSRDIFSETPQGLLSMESIESNLYATNVSIENSDVISNTSQDGNTKTNTTADTSNKTTSNVNLNETFNKNINGVDGNISDLLISFRETFLNIDMSIIEELNSCFMNIY